jgi:hypothetical protein
MNTRGSLGYGQSRVGIAKADASLSTMHALGEHRFFAFHLAVFHIALTLLLARVLSEFSSDGFREALFQLS